MARANFRIVCRASEAVDPTLTIAYNYMQKTLCGVGGVERDEITAGPRLEITSGPPSGELSSPPAPQPTF